MNRIFHRYRPHETGTFVAWEDSKRIVYRRDDGREVKWRLQTGLDVDKTDYRPGMAIGVQLGEMTRQSSHAHGGTRRNHRGRIIDAYVGYACVSAISLPRPRLHRMTLRLMEHELGAEATLEHLRHWAAGASSLQTRIEVPGPTRRSISMVLTISRSLLCAERGIAPGARVMGGAINMTATLPDAVVAALPGRPVGAVVDHPVFADRDLVVSEARKWDGTVRLETDDVLDVADAIAILEAEARPLRLAA